MSEEIIREWNFWLYSILTGACMAFLYDVIRLFRRLVRHGRFAVDLEDIIYWSACFGVSFVLLYYGNNGVIRFAAVLGAAVGMAAYTATVGRFFIRISYFVIDKTAGSLFRLLRRLFRPVKAAAVKLHQKKNIFYQKCRLTALAFRHKIVVYFCKKKKSENKDKKNQDKKNQDKKNQDKKNQDNMYHQQNRKGETKHGSTKKQKAKKKKNAGVSESPE